MPAKVKTQQDIQFDQTIADYVAMRDKIAAIKAAQAKALTPYTEMLNQLEGTLGAWLDQTGQTSAKTTEGTVWTRPHHTATLTGPGCDVDAFMTFIAETGMFDLMDRRANATACMDYAEEHGGLPPGVKINSKRIIGVTKA